MPQFGRAIIKERAAHLRTACETRKTAWMQSLAGSRQRVLIERDGLSGHAENFAPVRFDNPHVPGEIMQVTIRGVEQDRLMSSEERRVGEECGITCKSRWSHNHEKTKKNRSK